MMILVQPMYSKKKLNGDSNYVVYTNLIRGMLEVRPDWNFVVIFPDAHSGYRYEDDGFFRLPMCKAIRLVRELGGRITMEKGVQIAYAR